MPGNHQRRVARFGVMSAATAAALVATGSAAVALADTGNVSATTEFGTLLDGSPASEASLFDSIGTGGVAAGSTTDTVPPIIPSYPLELLHDASGSLTEANQVLSGAAADVAGMTQQTAAQNIALDEIASLYTAESSLLSYDNGAFADLLNPWLATVDQGWAQGTEALLSADQAVAAAVTAGSGVETAVFGVFGADFQLAGDMLNDVPIDIVAGFVDPAAFLSGSF